MLLKISQNSQENTCTRVSIFNKVAGLRHLFILNTSGGYVWNRKVRYWKIDQIWQYIIAMLFHWDNINDIIIFNECFSEVYQQEWRIFVCFRHIEFLSKIMIKLTQIYSRNFAANDISERFSPLQNYFLS